ncbi:MAG: CoA pyrophosphatase [Balneolaceae bacterium]
MSNHPFFDFLKQRLEKSLPGREAQLKMSPVPLDPDVVLPKEKTDTGHPSSVLIPLFPDINRQLNVIFTLRTDTIRHAGQISFPGGRSEVNENPKETALRESEEEIGLDRNKIRIAGPITPLYLYRTDNQITPFIGILNEKPELTRNPNEVEEIIPAKLDDLRSEKYLVQEQWDLPGLSMDVPYWKIHQVPLWGATAMIMSELLELYREFLDG